MVALIVSCILAILSAGLRVYGLKHIAFQALAHVFMGFLGTKGYFSDDTYKYDYRLVFWLLNVVEIVCFTRDHWPF